jgi:SulP family sulfate permease
MNIKRLASAAAVAIALYPKEWVRLDVIAGLTTSAVVIPKAMAYAT